MKESFGRITAWAKKHPLITALIIGGVIFLAWWTTRNRGSSEGDQIASQVPSGQTASDGSTTGAGSGLTPAPEIPPFEVPSIPPLSSGGVGGGGGKGKGKSSGGVYDAGGGSYSVPAAPLTDASLFDGGLQDLRTAAAGYWSSLSSEEQSNYQATLPYLFSGPQGHPSKTPGGRSGVTGDQGKLSTKSGGIKSSEGTIGGGAGVKKNSQNLSKLSRQAAGLTGGQTGGASASVGSIAGKFS